LAASFISTGPIDRRRPQGLYQPKATKHLHADFGIYVFGITAPERALHPKSPRRWRNDPPDLTLGSLFINTTTEISDEIRPLELDRTGSRFARQTTAIEPPITVKIAQRVWHRVLLTRRRPWFSPGPPARSYFFFRFLTAFFAFLAFFAMRPSMWLLGESESTG
jgi:hypothetical protein